MNKTEEKIKEIERYLEELKEIIPSDRETYKNDLKTKAACERYFEKIIEAITDLAFLKIRNKEWRVPQDDGDAFTILSEQKIISEGLSKRLIDAKGMRNIIAHEYGKIDDRLVFEAITEQLEDDVKEFINNIQEQKKSENGRQ